MQNENERGANSHSLAGRGSYFLAPNASVDRHGMSTCFSATLHFGNSERVAMKHYLQVTDRQFSEDAGVAQGVARMQLSQVVALLIERWDELDSHSREEILWKLE